MKELEPPTTLSHYRIVSRLGAGGMGEVYRARDEKLNRDVAIKVLPEAFAVDESRLVRFKREAQVLASLIQTSLRSIDWKNPMALLHSSWNSSTDQHSLSSLPTVTEAAHERGIIHRDLT